MLIVPFLQFAKSYFSIIQSEEYENEIVNLTKELTKSKLEKQNMELDFNQKQDEINNLKISCNSLQDIQAKHFETEQRLNSMISLNRIREEKMTNLNDLLPKNIQTKNIMISPREDSSKDNIVNDLTSIIYKQISTRGESVTGEIEQLKSTVNDLNGKLANLKLDNEALTIKCTLVDQDNQSLRQTLTSVKYNEGKR